MLGLRQYLHEVPLFADLESKELDTIFELSVARTFGAGQVLFREGTTSDSLWVVLTGDVEVSREDKVLAELGPGAALGEMSLFTLTGKRSATVKAICACEALRIPVDPLRKLIAKHDLAALKIVNHLAHQMAERLSALNERVLNGKKGLSVARSELRRVMF